MTEDKAATGTEIAPQEDSKEPMAVGDVLTPSIYGMSSDEWTLVHMMEVQVHENEVFRQALETRKETDQVYVSMDHSWGVRLGLYCDPQAGEVREVGERSVYFDMSAENARALAKMLMEAADKLDDPTTVRRNGVPNSGIYVWR